MVVSIKSHGTMVEINYKNETYYGLLCVDFERFKTFGNTDISVDSLTLFDHEYNKIPYGDPIYEILEERVERTVLNEEDEDDEHWEP